MIYFISQIHWHVAIDMGDLWNLINVGCAMLCWIGNVYHAFGRWLCLLVDCVRTTCWISSFMDCSTNHSANNTSKFLILFNKMTFAISLYPSTAMFYVFYSLIYALECFSVDLTSIEWTTHICILIKVPPIVFFLIPFRLSSLWRSLNMQLNHFFQNVNLQT